MNYQSNNFTPFVNFRIVDDLINQSRNGKYGDTPGIGQLIHQVIRRLF